MSSMSSTCIKVSHMASCIYCNSCNLFDSTHAHTNMLNCNELQMFSATQKPNYNASCKSPHLLIVKAYLPIQTYLYAYLSLFAYLLIYYLG